MAWFLAVALLGWRHTVLLLSRFLLAMATAFWALSTLWAGRDTPKLLLRYAVAAGLAISIVIPVTQSFAASCKTGTVPKVGIVNYITQNHGQPVTDPPLLGLN